MKDKFGGTAFAQQAGLLAAKTYYDKGNTDGAKAALTGRNTAGQTLNTVGLVAQGAVQQKIVNGPFIPNAPGTVQRKGSDRPLIDTGALRQAVSYVIEDKG